MSTNWNSVVPYIMIQRYKLLLSNNEHSFDSALFMFIVVRYCFFFLLSMLSASQAFLAYQSTHSHQMGHRCIWNHTDWRYGDYPITKFSHHFLIFRNIIYFSLVIFVWILKRSYYKSNDWSNCISIRRQFGWGIRNYSHIRFSFNGRFQLVSILWCQCEENWSWDNHHTFN